jgi:signal transduction histidine kinase
MISLHVIYQRLYYLPIFAAAYWYGRRGAVLASVLSAASYLPHIATDWVEHLPYQETQYAELVMFLVVGLVVGSLVEAEKRQRERQERTSRELAEAYRQLQESFDQLQRAGRLSALGQLSAGLAHEIRNPLASVSGSLQILASDFPEGHSKREFVEIIQKELARLNQVLTEFLHFARTPKPDRQACDLREVVESIRVLCSQEASRQGVHIQVSYPDDLPEVFVDAAQIQQALLNIVLNAVQVMDSGGQLIIAVKNNSSGVQIEIQDNGPGIPAEHRSQVFDPFFTTKDRGTGLGMSIAHKLIHGHKGNIRLLDNGRPGTTFIIDLPLRRSGDERENTHRG